MIEVLPLSEAAGAEVRCGNIRDLDDTSFREIYQAWLDHLVLLFRDQPLSPRGLATFSQRFGPLKSAPVGPDGKEYLELHVVSNVKENGIPRGILGDGEVDWHTDMVSFIHPPTASVLYALEIPRAGGDTLFNNMYLAFETLPDGLKQRVVELTIKHEVSANSAGPGTGAVHPCVCTHPETGANSLYLGSRHNTYITELPREESTQLLNLLWTHATQQRFGWRQHWRAGDVVVWDNRCLMHYREPFDPTSRRILHRTQVQGSIPPQIAPNALECPPHPRGLKLYSVA